MFLDESRNSSSPDDCQESGVTSRRPAVVKSSARAALQSMAILLLSGWMFVLGEKLPNVPRVLRMSLVGESLAEIGDVPVHFVFDGAL
jgi:hypothetical protein